MFGLQQKVRTLKFFRKLYADFELVFSSKGKHDTWYSYTTANSNLRNHLEAEHKEEYLRVCEEKGWEMQLPKLKLQRLNAAAADSFGDRSEPSRSTFTKELFLQHLINFITADDQVHYLTMCPHPPHSIF